MRLSLGETEQGSPRDAGPPSSPRDHVRVRQDVGREQHGNHDKGAGKYGVHGVRGLRTEDPKISGLPACGCLRVKALTAGGRRVL